MIFAETKQKKELSVSKLASRHSEHEKYLNTSLTSDALKLKNQYQN